MKSFIITLFSVLMCSIGLQAQLSITSINTTNVTCPGLCNGTLTVNTTGGTGTLLYSIGGPTQTSNVFTGLCAGTYTVTVTDGVPNTAVATANIGSPSPLTYTVVTQNESGTFTCDGGAQVFITGGTPPYSITWYNSSMTPIMTGTSTIIMSLCQGNYFVSVTDANGCSSAGPGGTSLYSFFIGSGAACTATTIVNATSNATCNGMCNGSAIITTTGGGGLYQVSGSFSGSPITYTSSATITGLCAGTHTLVVSDFSAPTCFYPVVITVSQPPALTFTTSVSNASGPSLCNGSIVVSASGGTGSVMYSKDGGTSYQASNTFSGLCAGNYTICIKDANNCTVCNTYSVGSSCTMASTTTSQVNVSCNGLCDGSVLLLTTGGTPPYVFNHPVTSMPTTYTSVVPVSGLCGGTYTLVINDAAGCSNTLVVTISEPTAVSVSATPSPTTSGCNGSITASASGGTAPYEYTINGGTPQSSGVFSSLCSGSYTVCAIDNNGCESCTTVAVSTTACTLVSTTVSMSPATCSYNCDGSIVVLSSGGTLPYMLNHPITGMPMTYTSALPLTGLCAGVYTVITQDAAGCFYTIVFTITAPTALVANASIVSHPSAIGACDGVMTGTITGGTSPYIYYWAACPSYTGVGTTATITGLCEGSYALIAVDANGCMDTTACDSLIDPPTGIISNNKEFAFTVYPNPADQSITIATEYNDIFNYKIMDMTGKIVDEKDIRSGAIIITSGLQQGIYHLQITSSDQLSRTVRLVISR